MKRRRNYNVRLVRTRQSYSVAEISSLFGIHDRTVRTWYTEGLVPVEASGRPLLFMGFEIKRFLTSRQALRKCRLADQEFYCPRCRTGRAPDPSQVTVVITNRRMGRCDRQVLLKGLCPICECRLTKFATLNSLKSSLWSSLLTRTDTGLERDLDPPVNTDLG